MNIHHEASTHMLPQMLFTRRSSLMKSPSGHAGEQARTEECLASEPWPDPWLPRDFTSPSLKQWQMAAATGGEGLWRTYEYAKHCVKDFVSIWFSLAIITEYQYSHCVGQETKTQRDRVTVPRPRQRVAGAAFKLRCLTTNHGAFWGAWTTQDYKFL